MPRADTHIIKTTDSKSPIATSLHADGNRPANASDVIIEGTTTHGSDIIIKTRGGVSLFGTDEAAYHAELNGAFYHKGASVALANAWNSNTFTASTSGLRHANIGTQWKTNSSGRLSTPYLSDTLPSSSKKLYFSYHTKFGSSVYKSTAASIASKTGNLIGGTDRARGEICNVTLTNATVTTAYVTYEDGSYITLDFIGTQPVSADTVGATVVGQTSGNTVIIGTVVAPIGSAKYSRIMHGNTGSGARSWLIPLHTSNGSIDYDYWDAGGSEVPTSGSIGNNLTTQSVNTWEFHEIEYDLDTGWCRWIKNGQILIESTDIIPDAGNTIGLRPTLVGMDLPGILTIPETSVGAMQLIDSLFFTTSRRRVVLTDNINYAASTKWENQMHTAWNTSKIPIKLNRGEIISGGALHIFNEAGIIISSVGA